MAKLGSQGAGVVAVVAGCARRPGVGLHPREQVKNLQNPSGQQSESCR